MSSIIPGHTRLRIDFVVREVCPDGTVHEDDLRFIKFGDEVEKVHVRDFFDRVAHAMGLMFQPEGGHVVFFESVGPNKIDTIKLVRELTQCGLKEAKGLVEAPPGIPFLITKTHTDLKEIIHRFEERGAKVGARTLRTEDLVARADLFAPVEYHRLP